MAGVHAPYLIGESRSLSVGHLRGGNGRVQCLSIHERLERGVRLRGRVRRCAARAILTSGGDEAQTEQQECIDPCTCTHHVEGLCKIRTQLFCRFGLQVLH